LPTHYGEISYSIKKNEGKYTLNVYGNINLPPGGIIIKNFNESKLPKKVSVNGKPIKEYDTSRIVVKEFPAEAEIFY
jgi:hypothetical protein